MNEQMQKLELEAIAYADSKVPANDRYNDIYHSIVRGKFAELLIKECLSIAHQEHKNALEFEWDNDDTAQTIRDSISEHFGVEE